MVAMSRTDTAPARRDDDSSHGFFGQPRALANIFGVEMWERFSFYGMQGILLIYLYYSAQRGGLGIDEATATGVVGAYGGAVYLSTILGAWLADRLFGSERVLFWSAVVIMAGHISLALIPGVAGVLVGLLFVALGSGGLKANATRIVGTLYSEKDPRRDAGFSLFYLGINLGAFFGPLLTGLLQSTLGFHWGFALAAVGMAIGLIQYSLGRKRLPDAARQVPHPLERSRYPLMIGVGAAGLVVIVVLVLAGLINASNLALWVIGVTIVAAIAYFVVILTSKLLSGDERSRLFAFIPLFITNAAFWTLYQQQFTVVTIYSDKRLNRDLFGWEFPVSWVQSINPIFIIVLSGVFAAIWTKWGAKHGSRVLPVPVLGGRGREQHAAARHDRHPLRLHRRRTADLAARALGHDEAGAAVVPGADGGVVLPLGGTRDGDGRSAREALHHRAGGGLLQHHRRRRDRDRDRSGAAEPVGAPADARSALSRRAAAGILGRWQRFSRCAASSSSSTTAGRSG
jgi:POT family proton-dependent oligopeptide transporter